MGAEAQAGEGQGTSGDTRCSREMPGGRPVAAGSNCVLEGAGVECNAEGNEEGGGIKTELGMIVIGATV